jgi:hypothetical protein
MDMVAFYHEVVPILILPNMELLQYKLPLVLLDDPWPHKSPIYPSAMEVTQDFRRKLCLEACRKEMSVQALLRVNGHRIDWD